MPTVCVLVAQQEQQQEPPTFPDSSLAVTWKVPAGCGSSSGLCGCCGSCSSSHVPGYEKLRHHDCLMANQFGMSGTQHLRRMCIVKYLQCQLE